MDNDALQKWLRVAIFNLFLVAFAGVMLRYKIAFSLPWVDQKYLLHGHSHFAFAGWITQALMSLLVQYLKENGHPRVFQKYRWLLYANLFTAYGMLISFPLQGYGLFSIIFSTLSIFVSYAFAIVYCKDLNRLPVKNSVLSWFKAAVFFNALSSVGAFALAVMLAMKQNNEYLYLGSVYFFLHFQYNGWFFFACMGLLNCRLLKAGFRDERLKKIFWLFFAACFPAYLLSTLWLHLPGWVYWTVVIAALLQLFAWAKLVFGIRRYAHPFRTRLPKSLQLAFILAAIALSIKLVLQALSVIPSLSTLAFGFRPIVIGYLHLVLLGIISLFILGYIFSRHYLRMSKISHGGFLVFIAGLMLNEIILMFQGIGGIWYIAVSHADILLLAAAFTLFAGLLLLNYDLFHPRYAPAHNLRK